MRRILLIVLVLAVVAGVLQYVIGGPFAVGAPVVSVKAEPVFYVNGSGLHLGPAHGNGFEITNAMLMSLLVTIVLTVLSLLATRRMSVVPRGLQNLAELAVEGLYNTFGSVDRKFIARFWPLVGTIFFYVLFSNWLALLPGVLSVGYRISESELHGEEHARVAPQEFALAGTPDTVRAADLVVPVTGGQGPVGQEGEGEGQEGEGHEGEGEEADGHSAEGETVVVPYFRSPSADLNNTLMLGIVAFLYAQYWGFRQLGAGYLYKFFPYRDGAIGIFVGFFELLSEFVRIISYAFRLFGNIFAGEVLLLVMIFLFGLIQLPFLGLEMFVGAIQAFVFAILVMAFSSLATQGHGDHSDHAGEPSHAEVGGMTRQNPAAH